jgi:AcrR family transcriptional regulator
VITSAHATPRRRYDSALRQRRAAETRDRIVAAGCQLLQDASIRDWGVLTVRAVAERAGVNERTVYRHLTNERGLRDAVMRRLEARAGIDLENLQLEDLADVADRIVATVSAHPLGSGPALDPTLSEASERQHAALLRAVAPHTEGWTDSDRTVAAAMVSVLWGVAPYERLVGEWGLGTEDAGRGITWVIGLIEDAVRQGRTPSSRVPEVL